MDYIKQTVERIIHEYETSDPYRLARALGIEVDEFPFRKIKGIVLEIAGRTCVIINANLPHWLKRLVLAHELGHYVLSPPGIGYFFLAEYTLMENKIEYGANRFAVTLLSWGYRPDEGEDLPTFAGRVGIPVEMMRYWVKNNL